MGIGAVEFLLALLCAIPTVLAPILTLVGMVLIYLKFRASRGCWVTVTREESCNG